MLFKYYYKEKFPWHVYKKKLNELKLLIKGKTHIIIKNL